MAQAATAKELDYLNILRAIERLPFRMGKKALVDVLAGDRTNDTVKRNRLEREQDFGCMGGYSKEEIDEMIGRLLVNGMIEKAALQGKSYYKVLALTQKGKAEIAQPTLHERTVRAAFDAADITEEDRRVFQAFGFFLGKYNDEQKKAIISQAPRILCVAGAGSGKTTVLTKRIEFLTRFCGVSRERVLAITFTRKARQEMQDRLQGLVQVETFNSFCERLLNRHGQLFYGKPVRVVRYGDRMRLLHHAIRALSLDVGAVLGSYFSARQLREHPKERLLSMFMHDCFGILDHYANSGQRLKDFAGTDTAARMVYDICRHMREEMQREGLRDYSDQLLDTLSLFKRHPELIPEYDHILVDEYQDVNDVQKLLLDVLDPPNLFAVGDPRQSIFGWRGSKVRHILEFPKEHSPCDTIVLRTNYRSAAQIVETINASIRRMGLPDLLCAVPDAGTVRVHEFGGDDEEIAFVTERILQSATPREEIFVLTRTNRQLEEIARHFAARGIPYVLRSEELHRVVEAKEGEVTLSTVHAIKGLEADTVFVCGCNAQSFPCIASERPVMDLIRKEEHDREEEELRLFYVALSRARKELYVTYAGTPSKFLTPHLRHQKKAAQAAPAKSSDPAFSRLREWRTGISRKRGIPPYMILPDRTLIELATMRPRTLAELQQINGLGPVKIQQYGEELLDLLQQ